MPPAGRFKERLLHSIQRPEQIDRRRPGSANRGDDDVEFLSKVVDGCRTGVPHTQSHAHCRCHADGRRSAHDHDANGFGNFFIGAKERVLFHGRKLALIDHAHAFVGPLHCLDQIDSSSFECRATNCPPESGGQRDREAHPARGGSKAETFRLWNHPVARSSIVPPLLTQEGNSSRLFPIQHAMRSQPTLRALYSMLQ